MRSRIKTGLTILLAAFVLYTTAFGSFPILLQRSIFIGILVALAFASYPFSRSENIQKFSNSIDFIVATLAVVACLNVSWNQDYILTELPEASTTDIALCAILTLSILELCRRAVGLLFTSLVVVGLAYALFGHLVPGVMGHRGFSVQYLTEVLYLSEQGIWGTLAGIAATTIAAFIMFGSLLLSTGTGKTFVDIATRIGGKSPGGAAKVATIASGLFGMLAGSSVANVATTGNVTIPMMKRLNYPPRLAAGVEAVASTGGQLAPPILGATAFIMAEYLNVSYWTIAVASIIPAFLFYLGIYVTIHILALNTNLGRVDDDEMPSWSEAFNWRRLIPLIFAVGGIAVGIFRGNSLTFCVFLGIAGMTLAYCAAQIRDRDSAKEVARNLWSGFVDGGTGLVIVGVLIAGAAILVSMINLTGLAGSVSYFITGALGSNLLILGLVTGGIGLVMGMGLPTIAAYVLVASMMVAPLESAGVSGLTAHMFVVYFAALSAITPPVCVAVFLAAAIARTDWTGVAVEALRLGAVKYFLPLLFLFYPALLWQGTGVEIVYALIKGSLITVAVAWLLGGANIFSNRLINAAVLIVWVAISLYDSKLFTGLSAAIFLALIIKQRMAQNLLPVQEKG